MLFSKLCNINLLFAAWKTIKKKKAAGGIDGFTILSFEGNLKENLNQLLDELKNQKWNPEPYLYVEIPKNETEKRKLGLLSVKDKIVQQAIKELIEPRFDKLFSDRSYGYRSDKGAVKAIRRTMHEMKLIKNGWVLKIDIDNYFDTINHAILFKRLSSIVPDKEILRLIELSIKTGVVTKKLKWENIQAGVPQGAVLSPLLANFYLHPLDQFLQSKNVVHIRYADDFLVLVASEEKAIQLKESIHSFLNKRLLLNLNPPIINKIEDGIRFLGVWVYPDKVKLDEEKKQKLIRKIHSLRIEGGHWNRKSLEEISGIKAYYAQIMNSQDILFLDEMLKEKLSSLCRNELQRISNKKQLDYLLQQIPFFTPEFELNKKELIKQLILEYSEVKRNKQNEGKPAISNETLINRKKKQYQRLEGENSELIVSSYGSFIGKGSKGIEFRIKGKKIKTGPVHLLKHITVTTKAVSISGEAIAYCMQQKIPIDFFDRSGKLYASILTPVLVNELLWKQQAELEPEKKAYLAARIVEGKIRNQHNLLKYFHKYHKSDKQLALSFTNISEKLDNILKKVKEFTYQDENYAEILMAYEAASASAYWDYIRRLLADDEIEFQGRERKGATDLFNSLLNYGYALLYARVWQAVLSGRLNPAISVLHVPQTGKPTLVYDLVELFRSQAVDRVVIALVQKGEPLQLNKENHLLDDPTKNLLIQNVFERLNRYENYRGKEIKFIQILQEQVREWAEYISGEKKSFKPYIAKW